jgi:hypothetical protein
MYNSKYSRPFKTGHVYRFIHVSGYFSRGAALNRDIYDHGIRGENVIGKSIGDEKKKENPI